MKNMEVKMMVEVYEKFLDEGGLVGWLKRNIRPMVPWPSGPVTLPTLKENLAKYFAEREDRSVMRTTQYLAHALRECGLVIQPSQSAQQSAQPSYRPESKLDELYRRFEGMRKGNVEVQTLSGKSRGREPTERIGE